MGTLSNIRVGLIGAGDLGAAMARAMIERGGLPPSSLSVFTRSGRSARLSDIGGIAYVASAGEAAQNADITLLAVPPPEIGTIALGAPAGPSISVMAGVTIEQLQTITGHARVIRAISNPAAATGLAYSAYLPAPDCSAGDIAIAQAVLDACGTTDEVATEDDIDTFTALTGPVPGFAAAFAAMLANWAEARGVSPAIADRAVRQLMRASGEIFATTDPTPAAWVTQMIDYAGTTAAGLEALAASSAEEGFFTALDAAVAKAKVIAK